MNNWGITQFAQIVKESKDGEWGYGDAGMGLRQALVIRGTDFEQLGDPTAEFPRRWIKEHLLDRKRLQPGDLIVETAGGTSSQSTGRSAILKGAFFIQNPNIEVVCASFARYLRLDYQKYSSLFIYYVLQALHKTGYMAVFNTQHTGVSRFQFTDFKNHTNLKIPDLKLQRKIAAILSAYDELIENNKRRIALLENMADEIYREWFVRFRFPGYKQSEFRKGAPINWAVTKLSVVLKLLYGKALKENQRVNGKYPVFGSSGIVGTHNEALVKAPAIIVGRKGNVGSVFYSDQDFYPIDTVYYVQSLLPASYVYFLLRTMNFINNDAAVPGLNRSQALSNQYFRPPDTIVEKFAEIVGSIFDLRTTLKDANKKLITARDLLLPRLISNKLSVENLDIQFPPGMAEEIKAAEMQHA